MNTSPVSDKILLCHILQECRKITALTSRITYEEYLGDPTYQDALIRRIEIIGEAAGNLSDEFSRKYPMIPVREMKSMRNVLAHQYFRVDIEYVWLTVINEIPPLLETLNAIHTTSTDVTE
ncbi:DUF86 domain-containing protein [Methanocorpusculum sp. MG]|uniref:DUF86 domain-containing protein n=1 Tax=Methanocorpusculum petauri TaxID=3002863 RepID=A0ABT4IJU2_9EURY|nr:DUF86 domain-containing protein [Methanocorpusculum petauri]MCZ0861363.1 DUF86 domain-containing protein [Methanocorpusculum petauri]MDE2443710.1 DUF86 domain-containing protein [Methanocorpusculum sp.]